MISEYRGKKLPLSSTLGKVFLKHINQVMQEGQDLANMGKKDISGRGTKRSKGTKVEKCMCLY